MRYYDLVRIMDKQTSRLDTKIVRAQKLELFDGQGRKMVVLDVDHGVPCIAVYDGRGKIRSWLTFKVDGTPDIRFFDVDKHASNRRRQ